jgi:hypothetical protein
VRLEAPPDASVAIGFNAGLDYNLYTGLKNVGSRAQSRLQGNAGVDLAVNRSGQVEFNVGDNFTRSDKTQTLSLGVGVMALFNDAWAKLTYKPDGGALSIEPNYHLTTEFFSPLATNYAPLPSCKTGDPTCDPSSVSSLNYMNHNLGLAWRWKFLPKTAFVLDANYLIRAYIAGGAGTGVQMLKASGGLVGLLSTHLSIIATAGWGQDLTASSFSGIVAQAELGYLLSESAQIRGGYVRSAQPVGGGTFVSYSDDRAYLDARLLLGGRLTLRGYLGFDLLTFRGGAGRSDINVSMDVGADYEFKKWFTVGSGYVLTNRSSSSGAFLASSSFQRHEIYARATLIY